MGLKSFEVRKSKRNGKFRALAIGLNGKKVWWTEQYERRAKALEAIKLLDPEGKIPIDLFDAEGDLEKRIMPDAQIREGF